MNQNCLQELPAYTLFKVSELGIVCTPINHIDSIIRASMSACVDNEEPITGNDTLERILEKSEQVDDSMDLGGRSSVSVDHLSTSISIERFIEVMQQLANANILYSCT